jgi:hypothetical protein
MLSRKHFRAIAAILSTIPEEDTRKNIGESFADYLAGENPRFNRSQFLSATEPANNGASLLANRARAKSNATSKAREILSAMESVVESLEAPRDNLSKPSKGGISQC